MMDELLLPEGITAEMTVLDLIERDRRFFKDNAGYYQSYSFLAIAFFLATALIFLRLALGWRRAEPFGRSTIMGLRWLGLLLIIQFFVGWALDFALPRSGHDDLLLYNAIYETPIQMLYTGPILSTGLMLLILSWVLGYGRKIKEEQALTV